MVPVYAYYLLAVLLTILCLTAWLLNILTLPGNWIVVVLAILFAWLVRTDAGHGLSWIVVGVAVALALLGELAEFLAGALGAAKQGASRRAVALSVIGAIVGSLVGAIVGLPIPFVGSIIAAILGGVLGTFLGAYFGEQWKGRSHQERMSAGKGAVIGRVIGTMAKIAAGAMMVVIIAFDAFLF